MKAFSSLEKGKRGTTTLFSSHHFQNCFSRTTFLSGLDFALFLVSRFYVGARIVGEEEMSAGYLLSSAAGETDSAGYEPGAESGFTGHDQSLAGYAIMSAGSSELHSADVETGCVDHGEYSAGHEGYLFGHEEYSAGHEQYSAESSS